MKSTVANSLVVTVEEVVPNINIRIKTKINCSEVSERTRIVTMIVRKLKTVHK